MKELQKNTKYSPTGYFIAHDYFGAEHCELCNHAVKYQYEIANENNHCLLVGSDCILKFECVSPFTKEVYKSMEEIRMDMIRTILFQFKERGVNPTFIDSLLKEDALKNGYTPKQMIAVENIAVGFKIPYNILWFKINLRTDKNKLQMPEMINHPRWNVLKMALSEQQLTKYENKLGSD